MAYHPQGVGQVGPAEPHTCSGQGGVEKNNKRVDEYPYRVHCPDSASKTDKEQKSIVLKALFNNVFTLNQLSCTALHAISVFDKV